MAYSLSPPPNMWVLYHRTLYIQLHKSFLAMFLLPNFSGFALKRMKVVGSPSSPFAPRGTQDPDFSFLDTIPQTHLSESLSLADTNNLPLAQYLQFV